MILRLKICENFLRDGHILFFKREKKKLVSRFIRANYAKTQRESGKLRGISSYWDLCGISDSKSHLIGSKATVVVIE